MTSRHDRIRITKSTELDDDELPKMASVLSVHPATNAYPRRVKAVTDRGYDVMLVMSRDRFERVGQYS